VDQLYNLLQLYEVNPPSEDVVAHDDLHEKQMEYRREIEVAQSYKESKLGEMISHLDVNIFKLNEQVSVANAKLDDPMFGDVNNFNDYSRILEDVSQLQGKLENFDQTAKTYIGYQKLFNSPVYEFKELELSKAKCDQVKQLWETVRNWTEKNNKWMDDPFQSLAVEEIDKEVQTFYKDSYNINKRVNNRVSEMLKDRITEFKSIMPNILDLGNSNIKTRHWEKIFRLINQQYYEMTPFNLSFLMFNNIMHFKDQVSDISGAASGEAQLEESLDKIKAGWDKISFTVLNHRDQHNLYILGSLEEIFTLLEDNQVTLQTMLGSRYISGNA